MKERSRRTVAASRITSALLVVLALLGVADAQQFSDWSPPVNLGPPVNTAGVAEQAAFVSKDGLSLYFQALNRPGGFGGFDIWVSQRASVDDPWGEPQNLGPNINTPANENTPILSPDGHRLYFSSDRPGGFGGGDLYVSRRHNKRNDFGWQPPVNLGSGVNTEFGEVKPAYFEDDETGTITLYFSSNRPEGLGGPDIYASTLNEDEEGETFGPAVLVAELSSPYDDAQPSIRRDGLEMFLASDRPGSLGASGPASQRLDLWVSTRASTSDPWSTPVNLGPIVNSTLRDANPSVSFDGTILYFTSTRPGGLGPCNSPSGPCVFDIWVTTRSKLK